MHEKLITVGRYTGSILATFSTSVGAVSFKSGKALLFLNDISQRLKFSGPGQGIVVVILNSSVLYCVLFTRVPSFWQKFKPRNNAYTEIVPSEPVIRSKIRTGCNILGYSVGIARAPFNFLNTFVGAYTLLKLVSPENIVVLSATVGVYAAVSNQFAYFIYTFGSIRKNCLRLAQKIEEDDFQSSAAVQGKVEKIFKIIVKRFLDTGTLAFGAMSFFLTREALLVMPVSRDFSPLAIKLISSGSALTAIASEIFSKNLDLHHLIDDGVGKFVRQTKETTSVWLYPHLAMGLIFTVCMGAGYFDGCLNVADDVGLSISSFFLNNIWLFYIIFTIFACSGGMLEFAFTVKPLLESIAQGEEKETLTLYQGNDSFLPQDEIIKNITPDVEEGGGSLEAIRNPNVPAKYCGCCFFSRRENVNDASSSSVKLTPEFH